MVIIVGGGGLELWRCWCLYTAIRLAIGFFLGGEGLYLLCLSTIVYNGVVDLAVFKQLYAGCRYLDSLRSGNYYKKKSTSNVKLVITCLA